MSNELEELVETERQHDLEGMTGPGVAKPSVPEIDKAASKYVTIRDNRVSLTAKEVEAKEKLIALLHANEDLIGKAGDGTIRYEYDGQRIELTPTKEKLTVKSLDEDEDE